MVKPLGEKLYKNSDDSEITNTSEWKCVLELDSKRKIISGNKKTLANSIRNAGDLRILTEFIHGEHVDPSSDSKEVVCEVSEFAVTYLLKDSWVAGIMNLRQPVEIPEGFGKKPSMSFFMYNENGQQAIARPYLDGIARKGSIGSSPFKQPVNMPKNHIINSWDTETNAPNKNFIYDFEIYKYYVKNSWQELLQHDENGIIQSGSTKDLAAALSEGYDIKIGVKGLCADLADSPDSVIDHEVYVKTGWCYYYTDQKLFMAASHPIIRCKPGIPLSYESKGWDFGWLFVRTDGRLVYRCYDPYTLKFKDIKQRHPVRWFAH
jgi:hypothetical protein